MTLVQVKLELGHRAEFRPKPTKEGFTHDWVVFVRGPQDKPIHHFVDKVVFYLHESFAKAKRVVREPPYQIKESGYAGFTLPIEVYFKNKEEPKKICFEYDLFLHLEGCPPVNHIRCEKLTFQNPTDEFQKKLTKAGGITVSHNTSPLGQIGAVSSQNGQQGEPSATNLTSRLTPTPLPHHNTGVDAKVSNHVTQKTPTVPNSWTAPKHAPVLKNGPSTPAMSFTSLFGAPLKPAPSSQSAASWSSSSLPAAPSSVTSTPKAAAPKDAVTVHKVSQPSQGSTVKSVSAPSLISHKKSSHSKSSTITNNANDIPVPKKTSTSAPHPPQYRAHPPKDDRLTPLCASLTPGRVTALIPAPTKDIKSTGTRENRPKDSTALKRSLSPHAPSTHPKFRTFAASPSSSDSSAGQGSNAPYTSPPHNSSRCSTSTKESSGKKKTIARPKAEQGTPNQSFDTSTTVSAPTSIKDVPLIRKKREVEEVVSPLSKHKVISPVGIKTEPTSCKSTLKRPSESMTPEDSKTQQNGLSESFVHGTTPPLPPPSALPSSPASTDPIVPISASIITNNVLAQPDGTNPVPTSTYSREYVDDLLTLQRDLQSLRDRHLVQRIVDVIVETRKYTISPSTFDFDLCRLEQSTVARIKDILFA